MGKDCLERADIALRRLCGNGLLAPFGDPLECVRGLVGIQSQSQQFAELSIRNRCPAGLSTADLSAHYRAHEIVNVWGQRHTLHMYVRDDWDAVCDIYRHRSWGKKYHELFPEAFDELLERVQREMREGGAILKSALSALVDDRVGALLTEDDYFEYAFIRFCCVDGIFFGQPDKPSIKVFVPYHRVRAEKWQPDEARAARALENVMLRYFAHYGPATILDFRHWSGLSAGETKATFARIENLLSSVACDGRTYYTHGEAPASDVPQDRLFLLGKFDPLFVSYAHKDWIATEAQAKAVWRSAARVEAVVLEGARILGTWRHEMKGRKLSLNVAPLGKIGVRSRKKIEARAEELASFWDRMLDRVTYLPE